MRIERCTIKEIDKIYDIEKKSFSDPLKKETMCKDMERDTYYCYGLYDAELVAFISYEKVFDEAQIISVATAPECRKKGYAKRLFKEVFPLAEESGVEFFSLEVRRDNNAAVALYESLGFEAVGMRKNYYKNPDCDAILMNLRLGKDR